MIHPPRFFRGFLTFVLLDYSEGSTLEPEWLPSNES